MRNIEKPTSTQKHAILNAKGPYTVQVATRNGKYKDKYTMDSFGRAFLWYCGINTHSGCKKRLINADGKVIVRYISPRH